MVRSATSGDKTRDAVCASRHPCHTVSKTDFQCRSIELPDHVGKVGVKKYYKEIPGNESLKTGYNSSNRKFLLAWYKMSSKHDK